MANDTSKPTSPYAPDGLLDTVCAVLREHLRQQPRAADTALGIERWWLRDAGAELPVGVLERALERLVDEGLLRTRSLPSGELFWYAPEP